MDRPVALATAVLAAVVVGGFLVGALIRWQRGQDGTDRGSIGPTTIVLFGDSLTEEGEWSRLLPDRPVANHGYSGFTSEQLVPIADEVAAAGPRLVLVLAGTNDIRDGHPPAWTERQLGAILDRLQDAGSDTTVVLQTLLPRADAADEVVATNERIVALAADRGVPVLDLHPSFDDGAGGLRAEETRDGLHLSEAGYQRWVELLEPVLVRELDGG